MQPCGDAHMAYEAHDLLHKERGRFFMLPCNTAMKQAEGSPHDHYGTNAFRFCSCPHSPTGRDTRLKIATVQVRILLGVFDRMNLRSTWRQVACTLDMERGLGCGEQP